MWVQINKKNINFNRQSFIEKKHFEKQPCKNTEDVITNLESF